jgi:hypothetical protein
MWRLGWAPNNANRWQMEFNSVFKGLKVKHYLTYLASASLETEAVCFWDKCTHEVDSTTLIGRMMMLEV